MKPITVFYAGILYAEYGNNHKYRKARLYANANEVYNGCYIFLSNDREWYRGDLTPIRLENVPIELRTLMLLMS